MVSIYDRQTNVKQLSIDCLPYPSRVCKEFVYHNTGGVSSKCKHIHGFDTHDKAKVLSSMRRRYRKPCVNQAHKPMYSIVSSEGKVLYTLKGKEVVKKCQALVNRGVKFTVKEVKLPM